MEEEIKRVEGGDAKVEGTETNYIEALKKLKETTVPKTDYEKVIAENKQLTKTLIEGGTIQPEVVEKVDVEKLRDELFSKDELSNLEYCKRAIKLRNAIIEDGGRDPFLPVGTITPATQLDIEAAERVATIMQECIDMADGDEQFFTSLLMQKTEDVMPRRNR